VRSELSRIGLERIAGEGAAVGVRHPAGLLGHRLGDRTSAMTDIDHDRAARRVKVGPAVSVPDRGALGARGDRRIRVERTAEDAA
jgi:hypothetical protein